MEFTDYSQTQYIWSLILGGLCDTLWAIAYLLIIRRGFKDKTYGMPMVALLTNLSWEIIFSFIYPYDTIQVYLNIVWFVIDLLILYQFIKFGKKEFKKIPQDWFWMTIGIIGVLSFAAVFSITVEFQDWYGNYTGFGDNMMMSGLFIWMLFERGDLRGQSIYIALSKFLGTTAAFASVSLVFETSFLLRFMYFGVLVFDMIYMMLIYQKSQEQGISAWQRV